MIHTKNTHTTWPAFALIYFACLNRNYLFTLDKPGKALTAVLLQTRAIVTENMELEVKKCVFTEAVKFIYLEIFQRLN